VILKGDLDPATKDIAKGLKFRKGLNVPDTDDQFEARFTMFRAMKILVLRMIPVMWARKICPKVGGHWAIKLPEIWDGLVVGDYLYCPICGAVKPWEPKHFNCRTDIVPIVEENK